MEWVLCVKNGISVDDIRVCAATISEAISLAPDNCEIVAVAQDSGIGAFCVESLKAKLSFGCMSIDMLNSNP